MEITWDEPKRQANIAKHGLDFADLNEAFFENAVIRLAKKNRYRAIGHVAPGVVAVIFATLGREGVSVVSMRPANRRERSLLNEEG